MNHLNSYPLLTPPLQCYPGLGVTLDSNSAWLLFKSIFDIHIIAKENSLHDNSEACATKDIWQSMKPRLITFKHTHHSIICPNLIESFGADGSNV